MLPASRGWRARMLLTIPQYIGWPPKQRITCPQIPIVLRLRSPSLDGKLHKNGGHVAPCSLFHFLRPAWHLTQSGRENSFPPFIKGISFFRQQKLYCHQIWPNLLPVLEAAGQASLQTHSRNSAQWCSQLCTHNHPLSQLAAESPY